MNKSQLSPLGYIVEVAEPQGVKSEFWYSTPLIRFACSFARRMESQGFKTRIREATAIEAAGGQAFDEVMSMSEEEIDQFLDDNGIDFEAFSARLDADIAKAKAFAEAKTCPRCDEPFHYCARPDCIAFEEANP